jgi:hypothetical protein
MRHPRTLVRFTREVALVRGHPPAAHHQSSAPTISVAAGNSETMRQTLAKINIRCVAEFGRQEFVLTRRRALPVHINLGALFFPKRFFKRQSFPSARTNGESSVPEL